jgi:hypothetical protein
MVEYFHGKEKVAGSSPVRGSRFSRSVTFQPDSKAPRKERRDQKNIKISYGSIY